MNFTIPVNDADAFVFVFAFVHWPFTRLFKFHEYRLNNLKELQKASKLFLLERLNILYHFLSVDT